MCLRLNCSVLNLLKEVLNWLWLFLARDDEIVDKWLDCWVDHEWGDRPPLVFLTQDRHQRVARRRRDKMNVSRSMHDFSTPIPQHVAIATLKKDQMIRVLGRWNKCGLCGAPLANEIFHKDLRTYSMRYTSKKCRRRCDVLCKHPFFGAPCKGPWVWAINLWCCAAS